jgi:hypothetical protein
MRIQQNLLVVLSAAALTSNLSAQTPILTGIASERSGTKLDGVRVTVKSNGNAIGRAATNSQGVYATKAAFGSLTVECEATALDYATNPVSGQVEIPRNALKAKLDCVFDRITTADSYWKMVVDRINIEAAHSSDPLRLFKGEWIQILGGSLPPSSKAAAAHQLQTMKWSPQIDSPELKVYSTVDVPTVKDAEAGDPKALSKLPTPVGDDVRAYQQTKPAKGDPLSK